MATDLVNKETSENTTIATEESSEQPTKKSRKKNKKKYRVRKFPIWLRIIVVLILFVFCLVLGVIVGYSILGDGSPADALDKQTWQHIIDIVNKE